MSIPLHVAVAVASLVLLPALARAETVTANGDPDRPCSYASTDMARWTPALGLPVRYIADTYVHESGARWLGLGYSDAGFWSAESGDGTDACDSCDALRLVLTRFDGTRRSWDVVTSNERNVALASATLQGNALRDLALKRLWHLAATVWPVNDLKQGYAFRLPKRDATGVVERYTGWMAEASHDGWLLRFGLASTPFMCWCHTDWRGFRLAAPK